MDEYESENRISNLPNCHKCAYTSDLSGSFLLEMQFLSILACPIHVGHHVFKITNSPTKAGRFCLNQQLLVELIK